MKVIICGGRDERLTDSDVIILNFLHDNYKFTEIVSGGCQGIDQDGEAWAKSKNIPVKQFMPAWDDQGAAAGPIRNQQMADYADACVAFPGCKGTADMVNKARLKGLQVWLVNINYSKDRGVPF